ncbi:methionyl-tRNA formyltransferase [Anseongella ginsenosidimutans]|uniref:Methionyl-tRNA formyltransferase n=2 Tax=Anseongella ginsenosidimutans TaxID=496056 RepID=A0A4R3KTA4_9SPHI|nr:methionyl-tRNA formyltransferase [Anseongella ginsenosidimutans]TCS87751.1 methionyl-tRNA formyltransferase [Anseongella ginsenosidimutans]
MRIVFMGTPEFAVPSLSILHENGYEIAAVVTAPDKPAGRGRQLRTSAVKDFALQQGITVLQPEKLKDPAFIARLKSLEADLFIVVAFRMLPEVIWQMPPLGTFNLHASLLPQYRGAAPINRAVMNGEKETGLTTFFLQQEIDTGHVLLQEKISIDENETAGELHDRLMETGARLVLQTVKAIEDGQAPSVPQDTLIRAEEHAGRVLKEAPKLFKEDCRINWNNSLETTHNFIRGLSPYPTAFTELGGKSLKIFKSSMEKTEHTEPPGKFLSDDKTFLKVAVPGGFIHLEELQLEGKKRMEVREFLKGYR